MEIIFDFSEVYKLTTAFTKAAAAAPQRAAIVVAKSALDLEAQSKARAPVDTGALRGSISTEITSLHAEVGPTVNYAQYLEWGTSRMPPQPFMGPALDQVEPAFIAAMQQIAGDIL